jgi:PhoH-like ATPase
VIKNYIIDTNVLLQDPNSIFNFEDNNVIIPIGVVEELDRFKKDMTELGRNARQVSRILDELREKGDLKEGVALGKGVLKVRYNGNLKSFYKEKNVDLHVIHIAQETIKKCPKEPCIIVSNDVNVRIRSNALGLKAQKYECGSVPKDEIEKGYSTVEVDEDLFNEFAKNKEFRISDIVNAPKIYPNYYLTVIKNTDKKSLLGRVNSDMTLVKRLIGCPKKTNLVPRNKEQSFLIDALMDNDIKLVSIAGKAGSGKTLLSTAIAYYLTVEEKEYKRMLVSRPIYPLGKDIGFLPGDLDEKLDPWMVPIYDAFDVINDNKAESGRDFVKKNPLIIVEPLTYIRGRSIHDQFLIVDEAQNLTPLEIKTIITRAGDGTKVVLTGDVQQIDNPYIDSLSNGLSVVMAAFRGSKIATGLVLEKGVRSPLAEEAANKLN